MSLRPVASVVAFTGVVVLALGTAVADTPHGSFGPVKPPQAPPAMTMTSSSGQPLELQRALRGKVSAVQLMFTACTATCPIQGALFAELQGKLDGAGYQLLSISIDAQGDTPAKLSAWLERFGARPSRWIAATPSTKDGDALLDFVRGRTAGPDRHSAQTYVFNRSGQLVFRSESMPSAAGLAEVMKQVSEMRTP